MSSFFMEINPDLPPGNGHPRGALYRMSAAHKINRISAMSEDGTTVELNINLDQRLNEVFGSSLDFALLGDKPLTFGDVADGADVTTWVNWGDSAENATQASASDRPSYDETNKAVHFAEDEFLDLPATPFTFGSTEAFTIFVVIDTITTNGDDDCYILGGLNGTGSDPVSSWGIKGDKRYIVDQDENEIEESNNVPEDDQIRMLSQHTNGRVYEYANGYGVEIGSGDLSDDFDFKTINVTEHRSGEEGSGTLKIKELLVFTESVVDMGATERQLIEGYLAHKHGLESLLRTEDGTGSHPYFSTDPRDANGTSTDKVIGTDLSVTKDNYDSASPPTLSTDPDEWDQAGGDSGGGGDLDQTVTANQYVHVYVADRDDPGLVFVKIDYTVT